MQNVWCLECQLNRLRMSVAIPITYHPKIVLETLEAKFMFMVYSWLFSTSCETFGCMFNDICCAFLINLFRFSSYDYTYDDYSSGMFVLVVPFIKHKPCVEVYVTAFAFTICTLSQPATITSEWREYLKEITQTFLLFQFFLNNTNLTFMAFCTKLTLRAFSKK